MCEDLSRDEIFLVALWWCVEEVVRVSFCADARRVV